MLRGLESFAQLPEWQGPNTGSGNAYIVSQLPIAIDDKPRFQWRGALIDSARHYLTVEAVLRVIGNTPELLSVRHPPLSHTHCGVLLCFVLFWQMH